MRENIERVIAAAVAYIATCDPPTPARIAEINASIELLQAALPPLHDEHNLNEYVDTARAMYVDSDDVEIDVAPLVMPAGDESGYWINGWMFVRHSDVVEARELNTETLY